MPCAQEKIGAQLQPCVPKSKLVNTEEMKKCIETLLKMPDEYSQYLSDNKTVMIKQLHIYAQCLETGDMRAWDNLKLLSKKI